MAFPWLRKKVQQPGAPGAVPTQPLAPAQQPFTPPAQAGNPPRPIKLTSQQQQTVNASQAAQGQAGKPPAYSIAIQKDLEPAKPTGDAATRAAIDELLNAEARDTTAEEELARKTQDQADQKSILANRARAGFAGTGLAGATGAMDTDVRNMGAQAASKAILDIQTNAREEANAKKVAGVNAGLAQAQTDADKEYWRVAQIELERELGIDVNEDGVIAGKEEADAEKADADEASARESARLLAEGRPTLSSTQIADMKKQGIDVRAVKMGNPPFDYWEWQDQFGNSYEMSRADQEKRFT